MQISPETTVISHLEEYNMIDLNKTTQRRSFLGAMGATAAAIGMAGFSSAAKAIAASPKLNPPGPDAGFEAWLGKITGKHKQVFDTPMPNGGFAFAWSRIFLMTNAAAGAPENDVSVVIVLRHEAIPFGMKDELWAKYKFGEQFMINEGATKTPAVRNGLYHPKEGELPLPGMAIEDLSKSGVLIGICDMALTFYSSKVFAPKMNMPADEIKKDWVAGILPGIQIVPSGVLAVNRAQEHGCTYCFAG